MTKLRLQLLKEELTATRDHQKSLRIRIRQAQAQIEWSRKAMVESDKRIAALEKAIDLEKKRARPGYANYEGMAFRSLTL